MIQPPQPWDAQQQPMSAGPPYPTPPHASAPQYQYQQSPQISHGSGNYAPTNYGPYSHPNGLTSPQSAGLPVSAPQLPTQMLPLPGMPQQHSGHYMSGGTSTYNAPNFDTSGQLAPAGMKPRVTATLWEDEGSLCFQVEVKGICVARREDNHMINGTKLLNVAGMTRGRRDGILKSEKIRHVVKIGPMHLKGVWIPFDRALDFANREKITEILYPLFVHNIGALLYHPTNQNRAPMMMEGGGKRPKGPQPSLMGTPTSQPPPSLHHHHSMSGSVGPHGSQTPHSIAPYPGGIRPGIDRAHTFPTPPTSASSTIGMGSQGQCDWPSQSISNNPQTSQPLSIDTGLSNTRSMPTTPATTPPGSMMPNLHTYPSQPSQSYDTSRSMYSAAPPSHNPYASQTSQGMSRYGQSMQSNNYVKSEMGPPTARTTGSNAEGDSLGLKHEHYSHSQGQDHLSHAAGDEESGHDHDHDYSHDHHTSYNTTRAPLSYDPTASNGTVQADHPHLPSETMPEPVTDPTGAMASRNSSVPQHQWSTGYHTPPRIPPSSTLYNVMSDTRGSTNGPTSYNTSNLSSYPSSVVNGSNPLKRGRDEDDHDNSQIGRGDDLESMKRRKSVREDSVSAPNSASYDHEGRPISRSLNATIQQRRQFTT
ncbi:hypothetical protein MMC25_003067 [Agyrium rufum]|nr:hypothetical protein [Agyrium rufum]